MVYWEFLVTGKSDFTQFDPLVAEKPSGLQGPNWEEISINRFWQCNYCKSLIRPLTFSFEFAISRMAIARGIS